MKPYLLPLLQCPQCAGALRQAEAQLTCERCGQAVPLQAGIPLFTPPPRELVPSEKLERGPDSGTPWRQANWRFLASQVARLEPAALILDTGAGRGDFADAFAGRQALALDVYPYPEIDLVCDLTRVVPLRAGSFDFIALMNVLEHVYDSHALLSVLAGLLKPGGALAVAIPFLVKIHQAPIDFVRYTHFALQRLGEDCGLTVELLEGYYDPAFLIEEGLGNLRWSVLPGLPAGRRRVAWLLLKGIELLKGLLYIQGQARPPAAVRSQAPIGYHIIYRKPKD